MWHISVGDYLLKKKVGKILLPYRILLFVNSVLTSHNEVQVMLNIGIKA